MVFMITFSFLNQTLWRDFHWNRLSETIPMSGHTLGKKVSILKTLNFKPYLLPCHKHCKPYKNLLWKLAKYEELLDGNKH